VIVGPATLCVKIVPSGTAASAVFDGKEFLFLFVVWRWGAMDEEVRGC